MGAGANAGGFAAGFGKGLSNALLKNRERSDQKSREEAARKDRLFGTLLPVLLENVEDPADLEPFLQQQFPDQFGGKPGKPDKPGGPFDNLKRMLGPLMQMKAKRPTMEQRTGEQSKGTALPMPIGQPSAGGPLQQILQPTATDISDSDAMKSIFGRQSTIVPEDDRSVRRELSPYQVGVTTPSPVAPEQSAAIPPGFPVAVPPVAGAAANAPIPGVSPTPAATGATATAPPAARRTLMGVPIVSAAERRERDRQILLQQVEWARSTILPTLKAVNPTATIEDALSVAKTGLMTRDTASRTASISAASLFDEQLKRRAVEKGQPLTADEVAEERQKWEALNDRAFSMGTYVNQALADLGLTAEEAVRTNRMDEVNRKADALAGGRAGSQAAARTANSPVITPTGAGPQLVNRGTGVATPITQGSPTGPVVGPAPTAEMRNREESRRLVVPAINEIEALSRKVITKVGPAQRADAAKRGAAAVLGSDPEWRTYRDARTALAGNLAVLQQGSRPSDADIQAIWLPLVPDVFADTTESAKMKWDLIRRMSGLDPKTGLPIPRPGAIGAAGATGAGATDDAARRVKARQALIAAGKQADDATITTFLQNNPAFK